MNWASVVDKNVDQRVGSLYPQHTGSVLPDESALWCSSGETRTQRLHRNAKDPDEIVSVAKQGCPSRCLLITESEAPPMFSVREHGSPCLCCETGMSIMASTNRVLHNWKEDVDIEDVEHIHEAACHMHTMATAPLNITISGVKEVRAGGGAWKRFKFRIAAPKP